MSTIKITPVSYNLWSQDKASFAKAFGESFLETGFAVVSDHTISADAIQSAAEQTKAFFAFPRDQKTRYADPENGHQRGYSPIGSENAKGRTVSDFKEFWHTGRDLPKDSPYRTNMQDTPQVAELPDFNIATRDLYEALDDFGVDLLRAVALYLGLDEAYFDDKVDNGNSILRLLHYPPPIACSTHLRRAQNSRAILSPSSYILIKTTSLIRCRSVSRKRVKSKRPSRQVII